VTANTDSTVAGGVYILAAKSAASGRVRTAQLTVAKLVPSIVAVPTTGAPGTPLTINGFGFEPGAIVTLSIHGQRVSATTANGNGQFSTRAIIPHGLASGTYHIMAVSNSGRTASNPLVVNRNVATHFYFASFYTGSGYHEYLALLNPTAINARVTIGYLLGNGAPHTKTITVNAHSRATEDVNADLGPHVSAGAVVAADVPIVAERLVYHGSDGAVVPGALAPSTTWYFANGNTGHHYREFLAIQNPNSGPVRVAIHFLPTHHRAFTVTSAGTLPPLLFHNGEISEPRVEGVPIGLLEAEPGLRTATGGEHGGSRIQTTDALGRDRGQHRVPRCSCRPERGLQPFLEARPCALVNPPRPPCWRQDWVHRTSVSRESA